MRLHIRPHLTRTAAIRDGNFPEASNLKGSLRMARMRARQDSRKIAGMLNEVQAIAKKSNEVTDETLKRIDTFREYAAGMKKFRPQYTNQWLSIPVLLEMEMTFKTYMNPCPGGFHTLALQEDEMEDYAEKYAKERLERNPKYRVLTAASDLGLPLWLPGTTKDLGLLEGVANSIARELRNGMGVEEALGQSKLASMEAEYLERKLQYAHSMRLRVRAKRGCAAAAAFGIAVTAAVLKNLTGRSVGEHAILELKRISTPPEEDYGLERRLGMARALNLLEALKKEFARLTHNVSVESDFIKRLRERVDAAIKKDGAEPAVA